jgi:hypothetical protein
MSAEKSSEKSPNSDSEGSNSFLRSFESFLDDYDKKEEKRKLARMDEPTGEKTRATSPEASEELSKDERSRNSEQLDSFVQNSAKEEFQVNFISFSFKNCLTKSLIILFIQY